MRGWKAGDQVEIKGSIRRRLFRSPVGPASRVEIEVKSSKKIKPAT